MTLPLMSPSWLTISLWSLVMLTSNSLPQTSRSWASLNARMEFCASFASGAVQYPLWVIILILGSCFPHEDSEEAIKTAMKAMPMVLKKCFIK